MHTQIPLTPSFSFLLLVCFSVLCFFPGRGADVNRGRGGKAPYWKSPKRQDEEMQNLGGNRRKGPCWEGLSWPPDKAGMWMADEISVLCHPEFTMLVTLL